jgi:hypothetical protein
VAEVVLETGAAGEARHHHRRRRHAGLPQGLIVNFVLKHVKKMVPTTPSPGAIRFNDALDARPRHSRCRRSDIGHEDIAFLQYTGGTTGVAKGAMLTHRNLVANMQQAAVVAGLPTSSDGDEVIITALPLYHIFALTANCLVFMKFGGLNILITNPRDMPGFVKELGKTSSPRSPASTRCSTACSTTRASTSWTSRTLKLSPGRRHGRAARGGRALEEGHRRHPGRRLWPDRNLAGGVHQPAGPGRVQRLDRPAGARRPCCASSDDDRATCCRWAKSASCACAARR